MNWDDAVAAVLEIVELLLAAKSLEPWPENTGLKEWASIVPGE